MLTRKMNRGGPNEHNSELTAGSSLTHLGNDAAKWSQRNSAQIDCTFLLRPAALSEYSGAVTSRQPLLQRNNLRCRRKVTRDNNNLAVRRGSAPRHHILVTGFKHEHVAVTNRGIAAAKSD